MKIVPGSVRRPRVDVPLSYTAHGSSAKRLVVLHQTISPDSEGVLDVRGVGGYLSHVGYGIHVIVDAEANSGAVSPEAETAIYWHVQGANTESIGIEQISYKTSDLSYWWKRQLQLHKVARWLAYFNKRHGIPLVYDPTATHGVCGHADVTKAKGIVGGHTDCEYPNYPTKFVVRLANIYAKIGWR